MRLTFLNGILPLALVTTMLSEQQPIPPSVKQPTQQSAGKNSAAPSAHAKVAQTKTVRRRVTRKRRAKARRGSKRAAYRPEYTQNSVEVINGASTQKVVFHSDQAASGSAKNAPAPLKVEVLNGASTDTQYFAQGQDVPVAPESKRPVVVGVQSSDTKVVGGNRHPVVTGITSSGTGSAKSAAGGGDSVTKGVAPQPKRPAYQPDAH